MRYKTLFRVLLKMLGIWFVVTSGTQLLSGIAQFAFSGSSGNPSVAYIAMFGVTSAVQLGIGFYLFFGGEWIVNLAIPSNRPYCPQCGYDLSQTHGSTCLECGVALPAEVTKTMHDRRDATLDAASE